ncbi:MAG: 50S ribosomal protein L30 [Caldilineales bacterium]
MQTKNIDPNAKTLRVTYVRSAIGLNISQKRTVQALGLRRLGDSIEKVNNPAIRGMIDRIGHLLEVEVVE